MRVADAILQPNTAYAAGRTAPMVDLQYGAQQGFTPELTEWVSNQQYIRRNMFCLLVEPPRGFNFLPNPEKWIGTLRALVERHPLSIDGLHAGLEVEVTETPVGGGGQMQQDFTNVTEAKSTPTFSWSEKYGMPITTFLRSWITYLMMDPHSKFANIATLAGTKPTDMLADMFSATMLFVEPDPLHQKVVKSWLVTNMWPLKTGEIDGHREQSAALEPLKLDIEFSGIAQSGLGINAFAQRILDGINITGANFNLRNAFVNAIDENILAARQGSYQSGIETLSQNAVVL